MVYNFNLGIGWASSGVEYAQSYRANMLRRAGIPAKFVFTDMFPSENIEHMTKNIGFLDDEVIWLYTYFTDTHISPVTFTLEDLKKTLPKEPYEFSRNGKICKFIFKESDKFYTVYMVDEHKNLVHRVEIVSGGCLIRKDYYTYCKIYSEYYGPLSGKAHLYARSFLNEDGSVAYEELNDEESVLYKFKDKVLYSKEELVAHLVRSLNLTKKDTVIIDRTTGIGQSILENSGDAHVGIVIHADHFSEGGTDDENILWNNYYEYAFDQSSHIDFFITATDAQNRILKEQFKKYCGKVPKIVTIPVGSLEKLTYPVQERKKHSLITASRLATEKHCDQIIEAVVSAREKVKDLTLDIYGVGGEKAKLEGLISKYNCGEYVHLMGQKNMADIYEHYEAYVSASQSEGFGLSLMEAIGSGLPIVGFDVRYGNQTFIDSGQNGYRIPVTDDMDAKEKVKLLSEYIVKMFTEDDIVSFSKHSYEKAESFKTEEVMKRWQKLIK